MPSFTFRSSRAQQPLLPGKLEPEGTQLAGRQSLLETDESHLFEQSLKASKIRTSLLAYLVPRDPLFQLAQPPSLCWQEAISTGSLSDLCSVSSLSTWIIQIQLIILVSTLDTVLRPNTYSLCQPTPPRTLLFSWCLCILSSECQHHFHWAAFPDCCVPPQALPEQLTLCINASLTIWLPCQAAGCLVWYCIPGLSLGHLFIHSVTV